MLNKLCAFAARYDMIAPGDKVVCAVSGGADSVALLFALYLLKDKLKITLSAAHFNHGIRGEESDRDEAFVRDLCSRYEIPLYCGHGAVTAGKKGLEAAARDARYGFFAKVPGKIATAHTADDNAETLLMHLVRGTGLKGLGGITPIRGNVIRPMLGITRQEVLAFLEEYHLSYISDSSNDADDFLRNRLRHHVLPLLKEENPRLAENWSALALRLRQDEEALTQKAETDVACLRAMPPALRSRAIAAFLEESGVKEPEAEHIALAEKLVFSENPSAKAHFPGNITICRSYGKLERAEPVEAITPVVLACPGVTKAEELGIQVTVSTEALTSGFWVVPKGQMILRSRRSGDEMRLPAGTKSLKKLFIDRKIPAPQRSRIGVIADDAGVLGVYTIGANLDRASGEGTPVCIQINPIKET